MSSRDRRPSGQPHTDSRARAPRFPYHVAYLPGDDAVVVLAVAHHHRRPGDTDLAQLVRESVSDLEAVLLTDHPTQVSAPDSVVVQVDPTAAREIVFNLLSNAAEYSAKGAPVEVTVAAVDSVAQVVVRNHGGGVTPGDSERIFDKFERLDAREPGTGLGLFISRGLARAHGGDIEVQLAETVGSEFVLTLPM